MKCPSCNLMLCEMSAGGLKVFSCQGGCGGLWFGRFELLKLDKKSHGTGARLLNVPRADGVRFFRNVEAICPHCETSLLLRHFFSRERDVEVCQCAKCGGFRACFCVFIFRINSVGSKPSPGRFLPSTIIPICSRDKIFTL